MTYSVSLSRVRIMALLLTVTSTNGLIVVTSPVAASDPALGMMLLAGTHGLCADNAGSIKAGSALLGWKCSARNLNQRFRRVGRGKTGWALKNKLSGLCLDAGNGTKKPGAGVYQVPCAKRDSQILTPLPLPPSGKDKRFQLRAVHSGLCLQLAGDVKRGGRLTQATCDDKNPNQKFRFRN